MVSSDRHSAYRYTGGRLLLKPAPVRYEQVLLGGDFNLPVRDVDEDFPIDRFSGGGHRQCGQGPGSGVRREGGD